MNKASKITFGIILVFFLVSIICLVLFITAEEIDNKKSYDAATKTVTISDKNDVKLLESQLITPLAVYVMPGKDRKVAEFTIESFGDYKTLEGIVNDMKFYGLNHGNKEIIREYAFKQKEIYYENVNDYQRVCKEKEIVNTENNTEVKYIEEYDCENKIIGTHQEEKERWNIINIKDELKTKITIGIFTDVLSNDKIEWVPTLLGKEISEWANWTASLNIDLIYYFKSDETTGTNVINSIGNQNLTITGDAPAYAWVTGKINNAFNITSNSGTRATMTDVTLQASQGAIGFWIYPELDYTTQDAIYLLNIPAVTGNRCYLSSWSGDNHLMLFGTDLGVVAGPTKGKWHYIVVNWNSSNQELWIDGAKTNSFTNSITGSNTRFDIGGTGVTFSSKGRFDEIGIWNRTLSNSEIIDLNTSISYMNIFDTTAPETTQPVIIPSQPKSNENLECYATLTDDQQINLTANWKWYKNGALALSGSKVVQNDTYSLIIMLDAGNTSKEENWSCEVLPFDGYNYGNAKNSTAVTILNTIPTQGLPLLKTISGKNLSTEDLICQNISTNDADGDIITNIFNWYKNSQALMALNLPFEINADDYSGNDNYGTLNGNPQFVTGKYGKSLNFDGDDYISISDSNSLDFTDKKTWQLWFKRSTTGAETLFDKSDGTHSNYKFEILGNNLLKFSYSIQSGWADNLWQVANKANFDEGNYTSVFYNETYNAIMLNNQYSGDYKSKVFSNSDKILSFNTLSWNADVPTIEELSPEAGMVGLWHMNEQSTNSAPGGADIEDFSGNNNHGNEFGGVTFNASGKLNNALSFDGINDYVSLGNTYGFEKNDSIAFEFWIKTTSGSNGAIASKMDNSAPYRGWQIFYYGTGKIGFFLRSDDSPANALIIETDTATVNSGNWHHVAITYDGTSNASGAKIYIDGNSKAVAILDNTLSDTIQNTKISQINGREGNNVLFTGSIDEFAIWNKSLSASEILEDYNKGVGGAVTNLSFSARSCANSDCSDRGSNWDITDRVSSPLDVSSLTNNKYFQFKADFTTNNTNYSPKLYNVTLDYSAQTTGNEANITSTSTITDTNWHLATITFDNSVSENNFKIYLNNSLEAQKTEHNLPNYTANDLIIADGFTGSIDEFKIYNHALTQQQISNNYLLNYNTIVADETAGGDVYNCSVTPNDGKDDGAINSSNSLEVLWAIMFNVTSGETGFGIDYVDEITCNYTEFSKAGDNFNSYGPYGFPNGNWKCTFIEIYPFEYFNKTITFTADNDKAANVTMSKKAYLTVEEHTWLEALYNCVILKDCDLYNLLLEINQTTGNIWEQTKPTDQNVVAFRNITNKAVDSAHNLTIDYTINIPIKAGYSLGTYLPVRIGYWFLDTTNTTCYNQGIKPTGVEDPYCQPLVIETLGPMGGSVSFTTKLHPSLPAGSYNIKEMVDIDPNNVWVNYGQDMIGLFLMVESLSDYGIGLMKTGENNPSTNINNPQQTPASSSGSSGGNSKTTNIYNYYTTTNSKETGEESQTPSEDGVINLNKAGISGAAIGTNVSMWSMITLTTLMTALLIIIIISYALIRIKKK